MKPCITDKKGGRATVLLLTGDAANFFFCSCTDVEDRRELFYSMVYCVGEASKLILRSIPDYGKPCVPSKTYKTQGILAPSTSLYVVIPRTKQEQTSSSIDRCNQCLVASVPSSNTIAIGREKPNLCT